MTLPPKSRKGHGAISNPAGRFESRRVEVVDDGWTMDTDEEPPPLATTITAEHAKSIISRNDSPDIPFEQSINPYRGCGHGCVYCLSGDTNILLVNGRTKLLRDIKIGDHIIGTTSRGRCRRYVKTQVLAHWNTHKPAYRLMLADGTTITASADHRFLSARGWMHVTGAQQGRNRRPYLTTGNRLMGVALSTDALEAAPFYRRGYLCGVMRGAGHMGARQCEQHREGEGMNCQFRLARAEGAALPRSGTYLEELEFQTRPWLFQKTTATRKETHAVGAGLQAHLRVIEELIVPPGFVAAEWAVGLLVGGFAAKRPRGADCARIVNSDYSLLVDPAIARKRTIVGQAVKSQASLEIVAIERLGKSMPMYDITTGTGDFIANGVVSHNCYARPAHSYVNLSPGLDFETKLFYKENAAELLREELSRPHYVCKSITLGANTDPYQPIERNLKVTRSILEVLQEFRHPVSIVTKGHLIERDIDILAAMAHDNLASVLVSVTTLDPNLKRILEPRAPAAAARLRAIRSLHAAGVPVGALVAPVIPAINEHEIEHILAAVVQAGARSAGYVMLRLPYEVKDLFREWLAEHHPLRAAHVMSLVNDLRGGRDNDPNFGSRMRGTGPFAELVRRRFEVACRRLNLNTTRRVPLDTRLFRAAPPAVAQLDLGF
jgi:DNA repair photolyase